MYIIDNIVNTILHGHVLEELKKIPDNSIDMTFTSPPYWGMRNYNTDPVIWDNHNGCNHSWILFTRKGQTGGTKSSKVQIKGQDNFQIVKDSTQYKCEICDAWIGELGAEPTFQLYLQHLFEIFKEVKRILKPTGSCWVNLGDGYSGSNQGAGANAPSGKQATNRGTNYMNSKEHKSLLTKTGLARKSLIGIPDRFKIMMIDDGWVCRNEIVWHKPNQMPNSAKDRFTVDFEKLYWFTKKSKYYFEQQLEESIWAKKDKRFINGPTQGNKCSEGQYALNKSGTFRKDGNRNKRTVWSINTVGCKEAHFAVFPEEFVKTPVLATCPENGIVLDMFFGTGTTGKVASDLGRNYIGIELSPKFLEISKKRLGIE